MGGFLFFFRAAVARSSFPRLDYAMPFDFAQQKNKPWEQKPSRKATAWPRPQERPRGMSPSCRCLPKRRASRGWFLVNRVSLHSAKWISFVAPTISEGHGFGRAQGCFLEVAFAPMNCKIHRILKTQAERKQLVYRRAESIQIPLLMGQADH